MKNFRITGITSQGIPQENIRQLVALEKLFEENIKITNYSEKIKKLFLIFIITEKGKAIPRENYKRWKHSKGTFEIGFNLNFNEVANSTTKQTMSLFSVAFTEATKQYLEKRKDFNYQQFSQDIKTVLEPFLEVVC